MSVEFRPLATSEDTESARRLVLEYLGWLNERVGNDYGIEFEVDAMLASDLASDKFRPPWGRFYLACWDGAVAGVGCLKRLAPGVGEIQRMYVLPAFRGKHIGRAIAERLVADARAIGYRSVRLESLEFLHSAHALYRSLGFRPIEPYPGNSMEAYQETGQLARYYAMTLFMELEFEPT